MADLTGRLLMDDSVEGLAMLAPPGSGGGLAPPSSPQDSPAGRGGPAGQHCQHLLQYCMPYLFPVAMIPYTLVRSWQIQH